MSKQIISATLIALMASAVGAQTNLVVLGQTPGWMDTGIYVDSAADISITAAGCVSFATDCAIDCASDPDGLGCSSRLPFAHDVCVPACFLCTGSPEFSLVGRIGDGPSFSVGSNLVLAPSVHASGTLYLAYNDRIGYYGDNSGLYSVTVNVGPVSENHFTLHGQANGWQATGLMVGEGDDIIVEAAGCIAFATSCVDGCSSDPDGLDCATGIAFTHAPCAPECFLCDSAPQFGLIGRINGGACFPIGKSLVLAGYSHGAGMLEVAYNDRNGYFGDNSGTFELTLQAVPAGTVPETSMSWGAVKSSYR